MKKYFVKLNGKQYGPATLEDLKKMNIGRDTPVWYKGLTKWVTAEQIPEIKNALFNSVSSSSFGQSAGRPTAQRSRRQTSIDDIVRQYEVQERPNKGKPIAWIVLLAIAGGAFFAYDKYKNAPSTSSSTPAVVDSPVSSVEEKIESKMEERPQKKSEALYPINYLTIKPKLDNEGENVIGTITNTASTATYKDVSFTVFYENANGTTLDLEEFTVNKKIAPGETINFKLKANVPTGTKRTDVGFSDAKVDY